MQHATEIDPAVATRYGARFLVEDAPDDELPEVGMPPRTPCDSSRGS